MFGFGRFFYVSLFFINAIAILNEERFLRRIGLGSNKSQAQLQQQHNQYPYSTTANTQNINNDSIKAKLISLIYSIQTLLRIPLIIINVLVIIYELLFG
ncbi:Yos1-like protein [Hanseniaspora valbyensis NRRL Y-1626]|uniref:Yos1-like protein n=1 Tax=Hanseniaspora valbyensis NRRL Y-1626 TaxID=766949 RepID=A0A1B7TE84_9ASCO|nr:Yos1-like protein [Hanseniaspora valbyensis NRRL Y-1626]